jgi:hypothetical protein
MDEMRTSNGQTCLDSIRFQPDLQELKKKLHLREGRGYADTLEHLAQEAANIARPRALYRVAYVDGRSESHVAIDGVRFDSRVLSVNLENTHRVFVFLATCGSELHQWAAVQNDLLQQHYADAISEMALWRACRVLGDHLAERYRLGRTSNMSPGRLPDWPIQAQRPLFRLLGDTEATIGVRLTEGLTMIPIKSVSGILFPVEQSFESCQLCAREGCAGRQSPYDAELYEKRYLGAFPGHT